MWREMSQSLSRSNIWLKSLVSLQLKAVHFSIRRHGQTLKCSVLFKARNAKRLEVSNGWFEGAELVFCLIASSCLNPTTGIGAWTNLNSSPSCAFTSTCVFACVIILKKKKRFRIADSNWNKDHQEAYRSDNQMYLEPRRNPPHKQSACLCLVPPVPSPANQRTVRRPEPGTSTASGWDLVWPMSACPITRFCSACLVPPPTPSRTGRVTSVSCPTASHVTSGEWTTCRSSSFPTQPTPPSGVYRYCTAAATASAAACRHFFNQRLLNPRGCCSLPSYILPLRVFLTSEFSSPQPPATDRSTVKVMAGGSGFKCYCLVEHISGRWPLLLRFLSAGRHKWRYCANMIPPDPALCLQTVFKTSRTGFYLKPNLWAVNGGA